MKIPRKDVLCIGEVLWDVLGDQRKPGGAPMNVALHLSRLNIPTQMVSRVGQDMHGETLLQFLDSEGLTTNHIQVDPELPTSEVLVTLDEKNNATYEIVEPVAWDHLEYNPGLEKISAEAGLIVYGSLASRSEMARNSITRVLESRAVKLMDVNLRPPYTDATVVRQLLKKADMAKLNEEELVIIAGWDKQFAEGESELMEWIAQHYQLHSVVVTRGDKGAILYDTRSFFEHPGYRVEVADTVGAGDAFLAGFISSLLHGYEPGEVLKMACATGAYVATQTGATPAYRMEDIIHIMRSTL